MAEIGELTVQTPGATSTEQPGNRPLDAVLGAIERREIEAALRLAHGQRTLTARLLRISRSRLYRRMEALGIPLPSSTGSEPGSGETA